MKAFTVLWPYGLRIFSIGGRGWVYVLMLSRSGSVKTMLTRNGRPMRTKNWTTKADRRRRVRRLRDKGWKGACDVDTRTCREKLEDLF